MIYLMVYLIIYLMILRGYSKINCVFRCQFENLTDLIAGPINFLIRIISRTKNQLLVGAQTRFEIPLYVFFFLSLSGQRMKKVGTMRHSKTIIVTSDIVWRRLKTLSFQNRNKNNLYD